MLQAGLSVSFARPEAEVSGPTGSISAEIDSRAEGPNAGRTSFAPGEAIAFLVYTSDNVRVADITASDGTVTGGAEVSFMSDLTAQFVNSDTASLSATVERIETHEWLGNALGGLDLLDEGTVQADSSGVAVARVNALVRARQYSLVTPAVALAEDEEYPIVVFIQGEFV